MLRETRADAVSYYRLNTLTDVSNDNNDIYQFLNSMGESFVGGVAAGAGAGGGRKKDKLYIKGIGYRKIRYYKNGNKYVIIHGKKRKVNKL